MTTRTGERGRDGGRERRGEIPGRFGQRRPPPRSLPSLHRRRARCSDEGRSGENQRDAVRATRCDAVRAARDCLLRVSCCAAPVAPPLLRRPCGVAAPHQISARIHASHVVITSGRPAGPGRPSADEATTLSEPAARAHLPWPQARLGGVRNAPSEPPAMAGSR